MKIGENATYEVECHRGEIRYMMKGEITGSEQSGGRPVIIVSNEQCNKCSPTITVVPITTQEKSPLPTHFKLKDDKYPVHGTVLCEQIQTCSKLRLGQYVGDIDESDMRQLEKRMKIQLAIEHSNDTVFIDSSMNYQKLLEQKTVECERLKAQLENIEELRQQLIKSQQREIVFRELYEELVRKS